MSLKTALDALSAEKWRNDTVYFRRIRSEEDLIYAAWDCKLDVGQAELVNPAWFSIGRAYLAPDDNYPCVICKNDGERIGFISLLKWIGEGNAYSFSYFIDKEMQGKGYGRSAAALAISLLQEIADGNMIKIAAAPSNVRAHRLYLSLGLRLLGELDGDELVFGRG